MASDEPAIQLEPAQHEELQSLQDSLDRIDDAVSAVSNILSAPVYAKRDALFQRIPNFWALVLEAAPPEIDGLVQPSDSQMIAEHLKSIHVSRGSIRKDAKISDLQAVIDGSKPDAFGEARDFTIKFEFGENEYFEDKVIEKKFYYRQAKDGWSGRVSEPVKIHWKSGKDLSEGLTDGACALWEAQKKAGIPDGAEGEEKSKALPEYKALQEKIDASTEGSQSFFAFFGYRGRWVSAQESAAAIADERAGKKSEEKDDEDDDDDEDLEEPGMATEVFPGGEDFAMGIAEDLYPSAISYFYEAMTGGADFDFDDDDEDMDEDEDMEDAPELDNMAEIKKLSKQNGDAPAAKKRKA